jgi:hypothetical protein
LGPGRRGLSYRIPLRAAVEVFQLIFKVIISRAGSKLVSGLQPFKILKS